MLQVKSLHRPGLDSCAFTIEHGESVFVRGPSGSGKSLLLRAIADLDPNNATITLNGTERSEFLSPQWRRRVMYFAAESGWWADEVYTHFADTKAALDRLHEIGMPEDSLKWKIRRLSSGEKQRLALLRGILQKPDVLLLDEPTSALDPESVDCVEQMLEQYKAQGGAMMMITHSPEQALKFGPRGLLVRDGKVREVSV